MENIKPRKVRTSNINRVLDAYKSDNALNESEYDFTISAIEWQTKNVIYHEFQDIEDSMIEQYLDRDKILNEHIEFRQVYIVIVRQQESLEIELKYSIDFDANATQPKITIEPDSKIPYKAYKPMDLYLLLVKEINKIKAKNGILINLFDESMLKNLKILVKYIYEGKFKQRVRIPLFEGIEPEITKPSKLVMWFQEKNNGNQFVEVQEGEVVIEYKKALYGKNGLDCYGRQIDSSYSKNSKDLQATIDTETIEVVEEETKKLYKSKKSGFVSYDEKSLSISNTISLQKLSRNNHSLASHENNNIEVKIEQHDTDVDSIGEGVKLTSETIHVSGHIGAKSVIDAVNLQIDGATHKESTQYAKFAKINRHKGHLRCREAKISLLEGGEVHATTAIIDAALGGSVHAVDVTIGQVKNNLKVYASNSITIKLVSGEDNLFKINYKDVPILHKKIEFIQKDIEELKEDLEDTRKRNPSAVQNIQEKIKNFKQEIEKIQQSAKEAKITIEKPIHGHNTIIFKIDDKHEFVYGTRDTNYEPFHLVITEDKITLAPTNKTITLG